MPKPDVRAFVSACLLAVSADAAEPAPLFADDAVLEVRIEAPIKVLMEVRPNDADVKGMFVFKDLDGSSWSHIAGVANPSSNATSCASTLPTACSRSYRKRAIKFACCGLHTTTPRKAINSRAMVSSLRMTKRLQTAAT